MDEIDTPLNLRPDLANIGIEEEERGVCLDTFENRRILRHNKLQWIIVYDSDGRPSGKIEALSHEMLAGRSAATLADRRPLLDDPDENDSDYLTGLRLLLVRDVNTMVPPWVIGATKRWRQEEADGIPHGKTLAGPPARCSAVKADGNRCMLWTANRKDDQGFCRTHLGSITKHTAGAVEQARVRLHQAAPYAADELVRLALEAESEPVRLKANTEILDRVGIRAGMDISVDADVTIKPAAEIVAERLDKLLAGRRVADEIAASVPPPAELEAADENTEDAVVVTEEEPDVKS